MKVKRENDDDDDAAILQERPAKKRRKAKPKSSVKTEDEDKAEMEPNDEQLAKLINPKVKKKKKDALPFSADTIRARLSVVGLERYPGIPDDEPEYEAFMAHTFPRPYLSSQFGGGTQSTFTDTGEAFMKAHPGVKKRHFMGLKLEWNPIAPQVPGWPGLFFGGNGTTEWKDIQTVLVCIASNHWLYVGEYQQIKCDPMTVQEWKSQEEPVKNAWCKGILKFDWGQSTRVTVGLRKRLGREPTPAERRKHKNTEFNLTMKDVRDAFDSGDEIIGIWAMKCVAYDEEVQRVVADEEKRALWQADVDRKAAIRARARKATKVKHEVKDEVKDEELEEDTNDWEGSDDEDRVEGAEEEGNETEDENTAAEHTVDRIIDEREDEYGEVKYRVRWVGYGSEDDSWEPLAHVEELAAFDTWLDRKRRM